MNAICIRPIMRLKEHQCHNLMNDPRIYNVSFAFTFHRESRQRSTAVPCERAKIY